MTADHRPHPEMVQDGLDDLLILDEADDPRGRAAFWASERIDFPLICECVCITFAS